MAFAEWLRAELEKRGYDFSRRGGGRLRLAQELGVTGPTISRILQGRVQPELDTLLALSRTLEIDLATLLIHSGKVAEGDFPSDTRQLAHSAVSSRELTPDEAMDAWGIHDPNERAFLTWAIRRAQQDRDRTERDRRHPGGEGAAQGG